MVSSAKALRRDAARWSRRERNRPEHLLDAADLDHQAMVSPAKAFGRDAARWLAARRPGQGTRLLAIRRGP